MIHGIKNVLRTQKMRTLKTAALMKNMLLPVKRFDSKNVFHAFVVVQPCIQLLLMLTVPPQDEEEEEEGEDITFEMF